MFLLANDSYNTVRSQKSIKFYLAIPQHQSSSPSSLSPRLAMSSNATSTSDGDSSQVGPDQVATGLARVTSSLTSASQTIRKVLSNVIYYI